MNDAAGKYLIFSGNNTDGYANLKRLYQEALTRKLKLAAYSLPLNDIRKRGRQGKNFFYSIDISAVDIDQEAKHNVIIS